MSAGLDPNYNKLTSYCLISAGASDFSPCCIVRTRHVKSWACDNWCSFGHWSLFWWRKALSNFVEKRADDTKASELTTETWRSFSFFFFLFFSVLLIRSTVKAFSNLERNMAVACFGRAVWNWFGLLRLPLCCCLFVCFEICMMTTSDVFTVNQVPRRLVAYVPEIKTCKNDHKKWD